MIDYYNKVQACDTVYRYKTARLFLVGLSLTDFITCTIQIPHINYSNSRPLTSWYESAYFDVLPPLGPQQ